MPWATLLISVGLYTAIPVIVAQLLRKALMGKGQVVFDATM